VTALGQVVMAAFWLAWGGVFLAARRGGRRRAAPRSLVTAYERYRRLWEATGDLAYLALMTEHVREEDALQSGDGPHG
jgi:hypothetical protein